MLNQISKPQDILKKLSLEEKCAQLIFPAFSFDSPDYTLAEKLTRLSVGGFCTYRGKVREYIDLVNNLQKQAKVPLLIACDFEDGAGDQIEGGTIFPTNMAVAATCDPNFAFLKGKITAQEADVFGVRWVFAPVLDCNTHPLNPIINTRAFSDDPKKTSLFARKFMQGLATKKTLNCVKHFPGHGDVTLDSHLELPRLDISLDLLLKREVEPFSKLLPIANSVMIGHLLVKCIDKKNPASLSKSVINDLLRTRLGYNGAVVTDALIMGGVTSSASEDKALESALNAGADILLFPQEPVESIDKVCKLVKSKKLPENRLDEKVSRILKMKLDTDLFTRSQYDPKKAGTIISDKNTMQAVSEIASKSVTVVYDNKKLLPLEMNRVSYYLLQDDSAIDTKHIFESEIKKYAKIDEDSQISILAVFFKPRSFSGRSTLDPQTVNSIMAKTKQKKVILVSFGSPYIIRQFEKADTYICTFSDIEESQKAAAKAIFGKIPFKGKLPVRL